MLFHHLLDRLQILLVVTEGAIFIFNLAHQHRSAMGEKQRPDNFEQLGIVGIDRIKIGLIG